MSQSLPLPWHLPHGWQILSPFPKAFMLGRHVFQRSIATRKSKGGVGMISRWKAVVLTSALVLTFACLPLVSAWTAYDEDFVGVNPWWYVYASVTGNTNGNQFYSASYSGWAYAFGWPVCWKTAPDTIDQGWNTGHAWSHITGHFYGPLAGYSDAAAIADVYPYPPQ
jgi:hypothetical protein